MIEIPISSNAAHFVQENFIFGRQYNLEFEWIEREQFWVLHVLDASERPIALGLRIFPQWPIFTHKETGTTFMLIAKATGVELDLASLQRDFTVVACETL